MKKILLILIATILPNLAPGQNLPLTQTPWSTNCSDASGLAIVYRSQGAKIVRTYYQNGQPSGLPKITFRSPVFLGNDTWQLTEDASHGEALEMTIEYKNNAYRIINMQRGAAQIMKDGINLRNKNSLPEQNACSKGTPIFEKYIQTLTFNNSQQNAIEETDDSDSFCSGLLIRAAGQINRSIGQYKNMTQQNELKAVSEKFSNVGMNLTARATRSKILNPELVQGGVTYANENFSENLDRLYSNGPARDRLLKCLKRN